MDTSKKIKMRIEMDVTIPQALALQAMMQHWNTLASWGASRNVAFFVDGDGNFRPNAVCAFGEDIPEMTPELFNRAISNPDDKLADDIVFDFDSIAWKLGEDDV